MTDIPLSAGTRVRLNAVFGGPERDAAEDLLIRRCGAELARFEEVDPHALERLRYSVLRLSGGTLDGLAKALDLAELDWRDLLVAARFANDSNSHHRWTPHVSRKDRQEWMESRAVVGVKLAVGTRVLIDVAPFIGHSGNVTALLALVPEPLFLVVLDSARQLEIPQSALRPIDP